MNGITSILMAAIIFSAAYGIIKLFVHRKERLIMIEKGTQMPEIKAETFTFSSLKFGVLFIGIGLGIFVASILAVTTKLDTEVAYFSMIFLFGGLALVIHHLIEDKGKKK
jgi:hypothetical protein